MRGNIWRVVAPIALQAAFTTGTLLAVALAIGVGAYQLTRGAADAEPSGREAAVLVEPLLDQSRRAAALGLPAAPPVPSVPSVLSVPSSELTAAAAPARAPDDVHAQARPLSVGAPPVAEGTATSALVPGQRLVVPVSFYYCEHTAGTSYGDGGGFCGAMADGNIVYTGAAACARAYMGQVFRIAGDPVGRIYRCADTGSAIAGLHRDIWFRTSDEGWRWRSGLGHTVEIEILP
ncbi:MAG: hypothetical protein EXR68_01790 [Dehalococcoidia bacterium]|nr:hypothetical protein [Dehalococcoidia bacterium]